MHDWYQSDEFEMPLWVLDLDDATWSVHHRRLCVWPGELDGVWRWEIQTYEQGGVAAKGTSDSECGAMRAAEAAARAQGAS